MSSRKLFLLRSCVAATCLWLFAAVAAGQGPPAERVFSGKLGEKYRIQMRLRREGGKLSGAYFYERFGKDLTLRGEISAQGDFTLLEYDGDGAQTGVFKGKWKAADCEGCSDVLDGNWSKADGTHASPFSLTVYPVAFRDPLRLMTRVLSEDRRKYRISIEYPQIEGTGGPTVARFNQMIVANVKEEAATYRKVIPEAGGGMFDLSYEVRLANDDLVSVLFNYFSCYPPELGARGSCNATSETLNYDLKRGRLIEFKELFRPGTDYTQLLRDYCLRDLKNRWGQKWATEDTLRLYVEEVVGDKGTWTLRPAGLNLSFDSPEKHPPGAVETNVVVPYAALRRVIRPDGPLAAFAR